MNRRKCGLVKSGQHQSGEQKGYYCTWLAQNFIASEAGAERAAVRPEFTGDQGANCARDKVNEQTVFGKNGMAEKNSVILRKELYLVLDDGWDVVYNIDLPVHKRCFGSLEVNELRFPCAKGSPAERLKILNDRAKNLGWKGLGIWVAAQKCGEDYDYPFSENDGEYWRERILWCKQAGVAYWKVDWGTHEHDNTFRRFLTETARELYPELTVEHAICCSPVNGVTKELQRGAVGKFQDEEKLSGLSKEAVSYSEVFRTYDVTPQLSVSSTLDRAGYLLPFAKGCLNVEDELYLAAALGCQMGVMRSVFGKGLDDWDDSDRLKEADAALAWQKIAPPFAGGEVEVSEEILADEWTFRENEFWYQPINGRTIRQGAPAVVSRNTPLPEVKAGETGAKPFVVSSLNPHGAYSVAVLPRTLNGKRGYVGGSVSCSLQEIPKRIALFGYADCFEFQWKHGKALRVTAASLLGGNEVEIPLSESGNCFRMSAEQMKKIWNADDGSAAAIQLTICSR
jgi:hypothetical protein